MKDFEISKITVTDNVSLITAGNLANEPTAVCKVFEAIAEGGVNVDMVSISPPYKNNTALSFTVDEADVMKCVRIIGGLNLTCDVNSANSKISVAIDMQKDAPGIVSGVLDALAKCGADVRLITASGSDLSMLIDDQHTDAAAEILAKHVVAVL